MSPVKLGQPPEAKHPPSPFLKQNQTHGFVLLRQKKALPSGMGTTFSFGGAKSVTFSWSSPSSAAAAWEEAEKQHLQQQQIQKQKQQRQQWQHQKYDEFLETGHMV